MSKKNKDVETTEEIVETVEVTEEIVEEAAAAAEEKAPDTADETPAPDADTFENITTLTIEVPDEYEPETVPVKDTLEHKLETAKSLAHTQGRDQTVEHDGKTFLVKQDGTVE